MGGVETAETGLDWARARGATTLDRNNGWVATKIAATKIAATQAATNNFHVFARTADEQCAWTRTVQGGSSGKGSSCHRRRDTLLHVLKTERIIHDGTSREQLRERKHAKKVAQREALRCCPAFRQAIASFIGVVGVQFRLNTVEFALVRGGVDGTALLRGC